ncbi:hypothetical protein AB0J71_20010 [Nonomuraea sp. NPDC049637]|uniref:hypothetical protein n=1 Tax=Nonomuraea sp. NPDC049637 TaxID=3154356 RepID=UPI00342C5B33
MTAPPPAAAPPDDDAGTGQDVSRLWRILAHVVTPTTFIAAIMVYFGAVRTNTMYARLGVDQSMLGLSLQDYALRSVTLAAEPLILVLVAALVAPPAHAWLTRSAERHPAFAKWAVRVMAVLGAAGAALGIGSLAGWRLMPPYASLGEWRSLPPYAGVAGWRPLPAYAMPLCLGLGVFLLVYCSSLRRRLDPRHAPAATDQLVRRTLCMALLLFLLLWAITLFAQSRGEREANRTLAGMRRLPSTVVYAARRLNLEGPGITETALPDPAAMYRFRYTGLRLLINSNQRYFLLPACYMSDPSARAIALPADDSLRLEFGLFRVPSDCPR